jgi:hypothetical protein
MKKYYLHLLIVMASLAGMQVAGPARAETVEVQWQVHQFRFNYIGMNTAYTCDGVERTLKRLLKLLGARDDARVETKCVNHRQVMRFHRILLAFAMPAPADKTDLTREVLPGQWQDVRITGNLSRYLDAGDCELLEQFQRWIMPQLHVKNLGGSIHCIPHRREFNNLRVRLSALKTVEQIELEANRNRPANSRDTGEQ